MAGPRQPRRYLSSLAGRSREVRRRPTPVSLRLVFGLAVLVIAGTLLLLLPGITTEQPLSPMEALFTATSAVTVTGMTLAPISTAFTRWGQLVLLLLVQVGGVGYMFLLTIALLLAGRRLSLMDRLTLSGSLGMDSPQGIMRLFWRVLLGILLLEGLGTVLLYVHWRTSGLVPAGETFFYALFYAVTAFSNASFDLFAGLPGYVPGTPGDGLSLLVLGLLVLLGGLGIPVFSDLLSWGRARRLSLHSRLTLWTVFALVLIGWAGLFTAETRSGAALQGEPLGEQLTRTLFQSVSARTAGYSGFPDIGQVSPESQFLLIGLMFVGTAPASMGGGITTTAVAVLVLALWCYARGQPEVQVAGRTISANTVRRAAMILTISSGLVALATWLILFTHDLPLDSVLFEVVSAFATVGLSLGITGDLNPFGQLIIIFMMFWGRLGAITLVVAFARLTSSQEQAVRYPEERVVL